MRSTSTPAQFFLQPRLSPKPKGFLAHPAVPNDTWQWGQLGHLVTGEAGGFGPEGGDTLIDLLYALGAGYRANASFVMNFATAGEVRKLKDTEGRYVWTESLTEGQPARLLGYPVTIAEEMPDIADGACLLYTSPSPRD